MKSCTHDRSTRAHLEVWLMHVLATIPDKTTPRVRLVPSDPAAHDSAPERLLALVPMQMLLDGCVDAPDNLGSHLEDSLQHTQTAMRCIMLLPWSKQSQNLRGDAPADADVTHCLPSRAQTYPPCTTRSRRPPSRPASRDQCRRIHQ